MDNIQIIIFDLDGTLYRDEIFYKRFISHILKGSEYEAYEEDIQRKAENILTGKDTFMLGHFYDREEDVKGKSLEERLNIQSIINREEHFENYLDRRYMCFQDGWGLVFMLAHRLGLPQDVADTGFAKVREEMLTKEYAIEVSDKLIEVLDELSHYTKAMYMLTNTNEPEAIEFTKYIKLEDKFTTIKYGAKKPFGLIELLPKILEEYKVKGSEILAIGDHGYNDLYPVKAIGGKTILTTPYKIESKVEWTTQVNSLEALTKELEEVLDYCKKRIN